MNMQLAKAEAFFGACDSCFKNFKKMWCWFVCNPDQSVYTTILDTETDASVW